MTTSGPTTHSPDAAGRRWTWSTNVAGFAVGMLGKWTVAPLDRLKLLSQVRPSIVLPPSAHDAHSSPTAPVASSSQPSATKSIPAEKRALPSAWNLSFENRSPLALWRGVVLRGFKSGWFSMFQMPANKYVPQWLGIGPNDPIWLHAAASALASGLAQTATQPFDQLAQHWSTTIQHPRLSPAAATQTASSATGLLQRTNLPRTWAVVTRVAREGRIWQGYTSALWSALPFNVILFTLEKRIRSWLTDYRMETTKGDAIAACIHAVRQGHPCNDGNVLSKKDKAMVGACSALLTTSLTYGLDTGRRNVQQWSDKTRPAPSLVPMMVHIVRVAGWRALYAGFHLNVIKTSLTYAVRFGLFDDIERRLRPAT